MVPHKTCPHCGTSFEGRANKLYCSSTCKLKAFRQQQTEALTTEPNPATVRSEFTGIRQPIPRGQRDNAALRYQAQVRRAELAHELEMEKLRLDAQERAREHELRLRPIPAPLVVQLPSLEEQRQVAQATREEQERIQRDKELDAEYGRLTEEFLDLEGQELAARLFDKLLAVIKKHEGVYRKHSGVKDSTHPARARLENLHQMQRALRELLDDIATQGSSLFGPRLSSFKLKKAWRSELRNSLLDLA